jgi:hypothetical protein
MRRRFFETNPIHPRHPHRDARDLDLELFRATRSNAREGDVHARA